MESVEAYADLAATIRAAPPRLGPVRYVGVDGPAGSGKTTFADRLATALRVAGARVVEVHTDDLLEGWSDLTGFWPRLADWILHPLGRGEPGAYRRYDWHSGRFEDQWRPVSVPDVLVVEGVTTTRAAAATYLCLGVFVVADRDLRFARGLARDGDALRAEWERWMAGEDVHFAADNTRQRADLVVNGAPTVSHDPSKEYVRSV